MDADLLIVGAGPAGMTAALYGARAGKSVLLLEGEIPGGQIVRTPLLENYPALMPCSGADFALVLEKQVQASGAVLCRERAEALQFGSAGQIVRTASGKEYRARALILALGAKSKHLGLPQEERFLGHGLSLCAACDGGFFRGRTVAVVGGGSTALTEALHLASLCQKVFLLHRSDRFRAEPALLARFRALPNTQVWPYTEVRALHGEQTLQGVTVSVRGKESFLPLDGLFLAIGQTPNTALVPDASLLSPKGALLAGEDGRTTRPWVYAAGDCRQKALHQLATAVSDGANAANSACQDLDRSQPLEKNTAENGRI